MKRTRNLIIVAVVLVAVIAIAVLAGGKKQSVTEVRTTTITYGNLTTKIPTSGVVVLPNTQTIPTLVAGNIGALNVKAGDTVRAGATLATIENPTLQSSAAGTQADYDSAVANIDAARTNEQNSKIQYRAGVETQRTALAEAQRIYDADRALLAQRAIARATVDADKAKLDQARVAYEQALSQYKIGAVAGYSQSSVQYAQAAAEKARILNDQAQQQLGFTRISAPFSGTIMTVASQAADATRPIQPGDPVTAGQALFTIASSSGYTVRAQIDEQDVINVRLGERANVTSQNFPGKTIAGRVASIAPVATKSTDASSTSKQVLTTIALDTSPSYLKDGMNVDVDILTTNISHALLVPNGAIVKEKGDAYVWVMNAGKAAKRRVTLGRSNDTQTIVNAGLHSGDVVIAQRDLTLSEGAPVTPAPSPTPSPTGT